MAASQTQLYAFTNAIQPAKRAWLRAAAAAIADRGVSFSVATAVLQVSRLGAGVQQSVLAEAAGVNPAAMLRTLDSAAAAGLLERRSIPGDRRAKAIHLLEPGQRLADAFETSLAYLRSTLLHDASEAEVGSATRLLRCLEARIGEYLAGQSPNHPG